MFPLGYFGSDAFGNFPSKLERKMQTRFGIY
jgi:hypothetical protein